MSRLVPKQLAETVVKRVSLEASRVDWDHLPQPEKTALLARWVEDPQIGGVLLPLVGGDAEVRMWLKEVALKRRARDRQPAASDVFGQLFGDRVEVISGSEGTKPHHAQGRVGDKRYYVCWGPQPNAKHLFWAALNAREDDPTLTDSWVVIVDTIASPTPAERRARLKALGKRCGVLLDWMSA